MDRGKEIRGQGKWEGQEVGECISSNFGGCKDQRKGKYEEKAGEKWEGQGRQGQVIRELQGLYRLTRGAVEGAAGVAESAKVECKHFRLSRGQKY